MTPPISERCSPAASGAWARVSGDLPRREVRSWARFHADQAGLQTTEKVEHRPAAQLLLQDHGAADIDPVQLKDGLGQIDPECCNFHVVGSFLCWRSQSTNMAQCDAFGVEPSTPSDELESVSAGTVTLSLMPRQGRATLREVRRGSA